MIDITAQVSLYPLRKETLSPAIDEMLHILREHGLRVEPGAMSSLITGDDAALFAALQEAFRRAAEQGQVVMVTTFSNACPAPRGEDGSVTYDPSRCMGCRYCMVSCPFNVPKPGVAVGTGVSCGVCI